MASMPRLRFPAVKMVTRTARFSFRPRELFFAFSVEVSSMACCRKARRWRCEQAPSALPRTAPARRSSRISPTRRNRMGPSWCARGRSAYAGPIAKSSMGVMALLLPVSSASFSAMNRWARWKRRPRGAGLRLAISSSGSCAGPILCRASRAPPASGTCAATAATPNAGSRSDPALGILGVLLEPASILAKAWDHTERIGHRARAWQPKSLLVTGAGPIGLLAALMGMQRDLDVHVFDHNKGGPKEALVRDLGGTYHSDPASLERLAPDILMECTGAVALIGACLGATAAAGIVCLTGVTEPGKVFDVDIGRLNRTMVLDNDVVFGTVNAKRRHYEMAAAALVRADKRWLARLITRTVPLERWDEALEHRKGDIKVVIDFRP